MYWEIIPKVGKIKTLLYDVCDTGSSPEYSKIFPNLLVAKLIKIEQVDIAKEKN